MSDSTLAVSNFIHGCQGTSLTPEEREFIKKHQPLGLILFSRNCVDAEQIKELVADFKRLLKHEHPMVLIDQEGGRVARLKEPNFWHPPAASHFVDIMENKGVDTAKKEVFENYYKIACQLSELGINVDCAPVCDLSFPETHDVIGDRSFGADVDSVTELARAAHLGLQKGGVHSIIKHIPGHGRARCDSHLELPVVDASLAELEATDFRVFKNLNDLPMAMTAHITFTALDPKQPVTTSEKAIKYLRSQLGYKGLIMTDDLSMKALKGSVGENAKQSLAAGCDILLHCNGNMQEMEELAAAAKDFNAEWAERVLALG
jgi:beta-N-acetylhexosaminidase